MKVDTVAARQDIADLKSQAWMDSDLVDEVLQIISRLSRPGVIGRKEFDLNEFFSELNRIEFSKWKPFRVAALLKAVGESFSDGLMVADHGFSKT